MPRVEEWVRLGVERRVETLKGMDSDFENIQRGKLASILRRNADTEFGRAHGFGSIDSPEAYRRRVPRSGAESYGDAWSRIRNGARNVLFADPVHAHGLSSGTTGEPKLIPFTKAVLRGLKRAVGFATASYMARTGRYGLLRGYALQMGAPALLRTLEDGTPVGYVTGLMGDARSYPFRNIGIPRADVLNIESWEEKYAAIEERYADYDVRMMFGVPGCLLGLLRRMDGDWPDVELIVTSGTALGTLRAAFERRYPKAELHEMYLATEGAIAFQPDAESPGMLPLLDDVYLEFVPLERWNEETAPRLSLWEVETGVRYVILMTTAGGLYAYSPGDVVRFLSTEPPRLLVEGRIDSVLSLAAEKLEARQMELALETIGVGYHSFSGCPGPDAEHPRHEWVIEFAEEPEPDFAARLDGELRRINGLYRMSRTGAAAVLGMPTVTRVRRGTFRRALERRPGQGKILPIYQGRDVRDELVGISEG